MTLEQEQEIIQNYTPTIADAILEYETALVGRQVEIISLLHKECILPQLGGMFNRAFDQLKQDGLLTETGDLTGKAEEVHLFI